MSRAVHLVAVAAFSGWCFGGELETDRRLFDELLGEAITAPAENSSDDPEGAPVAPAAASPVESAAVEKVDSNLHEASRLLAGDETGEPTQAAQRRAIEELGRLIEAARNAAPGSSPSPEDSGQPEGTSEAAAPTASGEPRDPVASGEQGVAGSEAGSPGRNRDGKSDESSDRVREDAARAEVRGFRADLVRDTWGHLPPRLREQILNAGSEEYLPQYDSLVRRYFESLANPEQAGE